VSVALTPFPGIAKVSTDNIEVENFGSVVGYLYMLSEARGSFQARLRVDDRALHCSVAPVVARELAAYLFGRVRVHGRGRWMRGDDGVWRAVQMEISSAERVEDKSIREVVNLLRAVDIQWPNDPLDYLSRLNNGNGTLQ
jgi:hypothetical protein